MIGARVGLSVTPQVLSDEERPAFLMRCPGTVARLDEPVVAPESFLEILFARHRSRILKIDADKIAFNLDSARNVRSVGLRHPVSGRRLWLNAQSLVLAAGKGNGDLRRQLGLAEGAMQRRPLHMVLARGGLPEFCGHCVDGAATRLTITSHREIDGRTVWQIGGQIAETGVSQDERTLVSRAKSEIEATIPGIDLKHVQWSTYRVDRAEGATASGARPEMSQVICEGNILTVWPTKLALAPVLAERVADLLAPDEFKRRVDLSQLEDWPRPQIARLPWEMERFWFTTAELEDGVRVRRAA